MFFPESRIRVFRYGQPADMRKSYDGLYALARQSFDTDPLAVERSKVVTVVRLNLSLSH